MLLSLFEGLKVDDTLVIVNDVSLSIRVEDEEGQLARVVPVVLDFFEKSIGRIHLLNQLSCEIRFGTVNIRIVRLNFDPTAGFDFGEETVCNFEAVILQNDFILYCESTKEDITLFPKGRIGLLVERTTLIFFLKAGE